MSELVNLRNTGLFWSVFRCGRMGTEALWINPAAAWVFLTQNGDCGYKTAGGTVRCWRDLSTALQYSAIYSSVLLEFVKKIDGHI